MPARLPGRPATLLDGPVELEAPVDLDALDDLPGGLGDEDSERGGLFRPRRSLVAAGDDQEARRGERRRQDPGHTGDARQREEEDEVNAPVALPRRRTPKLVSSHGRPVPEQAARDTSDEVPPAGAERAGRQDRPAVTTGRAARPAHPPPSPGTRSTTAPTAVAMPPTRDCRRSLPAVAARLPIAGAPRPTTARTARAAPTAHPAPRGRTPGRPGPGTGALPGASGRPTRHPQLRQSPEPPAEDRSDPADRDAEEVRSRMASLQRGWQRGREENAEGTTSPAAQHHKHHKERLRGRSMTAPKATGHTSTGSGGAQLAPRRPGGPCREHPQSRRPVRRRSGDRGLQGPRPREDSEHLAAVASGFHSLAKGVGRHFEAGSVRQTVVELVDDAFLFVTAAGDGSCLAVLSDADSDVGQVAYEMTLLVKRVGVHLGTAPRTDLPSGG